MRELLDANFRADPDAPVFLAGSGTSTIRRTRGTTTSNRGVADRRSRRSRQEIFAARFTDERSERRRASRSTRTRGGGRTRQRICPGTVERVVVADVHAAHHKIAYEMLTGAGIRRRGRMALNAAIPTPPLVWRRIARGRTTCAR